MSPVNHGYLRGCCGTVLFAPARARGVVLMSPRESWLPERGSPHGHRESWLPERGSPHVHRESWLLRGRESWLPERV
jgi:hypothetical protein